MPTSHSRWRPSTITAAAGVLLAAMLLAGTGYGLWRERRELVSEAGVRQTLLARVLEDHASRSFDATQIALAGLADIAARGTPPEVLQALLVQTQASLGFLRGVALLDETGRVLAAADPADRQLRIPPAALGALGPWPEPGRDAIGGFVAARSLAGLGTTRAVVPPGVGFIPMGRALRLPDGRAGLMVGLINPDALANFQQLTLDNEQAAAALMSLDGQVLASTDRADHLAGERVPDLLAAGAPLARVRDGSEHGRWSGPGLRDAAQLGGYRALRNRPFVVLVELPRAQIDERWLQSTRDVGLPAVVLASAMIMLSSIGGRALRGRERSRRALDEAQRRIVEREQELSAIFGSVQDLLFRTDAAGRVTFINERYAQLSGHAVAAVLGRPLHELFGGAFAVAELFRPGGAPGSDEAPRHARADWIAPDSKARSFEITLVPLRRKPGLLEWVGSAADVSGLMHAQAELRAQLGLARSLLASSPLPMSVLDRENRYLDVNLAWEQFTGRKRADVLGTRAGTYLRPAEAAEHDARDAELLASGGEINYETVWHGTDGRRRDLYISKSTFPDADGRPMGIVVCFMDISEFREAERATRAARDAALQASRAKSEFVANISHELRTPLQSILGFSEIGQLRARQEPRLAEMFSDVHRAGQRMLSLVNDLLDLSKIENSAEQLQPERLDLRPLTAEIARELAPLLDARRLALQRDVGREPLVVLADPQRLQQVLRNVLANAIKFSPEGADIQLLARHAPEGVRIDVLDHGPGVPPDELESIFEAFVQSTTTKDGSGGTGLGLAICRRIVNAHGGRIWAANRDGGGTVISITLPAARFGDTTPASL